MSITINGVNVKLTSRDGKVFATSLDVANVFEKEHKDVLRAIRDLPQDNFNGRNFTLVDYYDKKGEKRPSYELTRDGFSLIIMGFTGEKAFKWKIAFIEAFNQMEVWLRKQQQPSLFQIPQTYADALLLAANQARELDQKNQILESQKPRVEFADRLLKTEGTVSVKDFSQILWDKGLKIGQNRLFEALRQLTILDSRNKPYQRYVDMGIVGLKEATYKNPTTNDDIVYTQVRITAKGQEYIYRQLKGMSEPVEVAV
jgi:anti-repressor protein